MAFRIRAKLVGNQYFCHFLFFRSGRGCSLEDFFISPVEPGCQCRHIGAFHSRTAPETQPRRRIAIATNIIRSPPLPPDASQSVSARQQERQHRAAHYPTTLGQIEVQERVNGSFARNSTQSRVATHLSIAAKIRLAPRNQRFQSANGLCPFQRIEGNPQPPAWDGVLIVSPLKGPFFKFAPLGQSENFRQRPAAARRIQAARRRAVITPACRAAASPPRTFCQGPGRDINLVPGDIHGKKPPTSHRRRSIPCGPPESSHHSGPARPLVVPFQVKTTSRSKSTCPRSGSKPYSAFNAPHVIQLQLVGHITDPSCPERFPSEHIDAAGRPASSTWPFPLPLYQRQEQWRDGSHPAGATGRDDGQ